MTWLLLLLAISYLLFIAGVSHLWFYKKVISSSSQPTSSSFITIIIPSRNEEKRLPALLHSIEKQDVNKDRFEVLVINDHSTDSTAEITKKFSGVKCLSLTGNPGSNNKKEAIKTGVSHSKGELIITTDADCVWPPQLLSTVITYFEKKQCDVLCGPVAISHSGKDSWLEKFEQIDTAGMMLVTSAGIDSRTFYLGNGAFLAYRKRAFLETKPYHNNQSEASGDDVFLTAAMASAGKKIEFLKSDGIIVETPANHQFSAFVQQRLRWSQKNKKLAASPALSVAMGIPFIFCMSLLICTFLSIIFPSWSEVVVWSWGLKIAADLLLFFTMRRFFRLRIPAWQALVISFFHALYIGYFGLAGVFDFPYEWKKVKK